MATKSGEPAAKRVHVNQEPIHNAVREDEAGEVRRLLLENPENLEARDGMLRTPLILASEKGQLKAVAALLIAGANTQAEDNQELSALDFIEDFDDEQVASAY